MANFTKDNITGTSTRTPTTVVNVATDDSPNRDIATATDSSKKLDAPIIPHGAAIEYGSFANCVIAGLGLQHVSSCLDSYQNCVLNPYG